ncbi:YlzJ-like family protein [Paenibacillus sedimenti]|uniref:YlzJ-like family protein n=1 Tax=Paenibacillus sedimenti TaxID=2770274 RepID=A0A926KNM8_9BACL|nr:YlzJ-like family protein [Paenibacillus sedimenti]MBD0380296.1 YlzJ-like family protein [Paenibacillus sedimenti]
MILYSVIPMEDVFQGMDSFAPNYMEISHQGVMMQVEPISGFQARIVRLLSCNPQDYLKEQYTPGSVIAYSPDLPRSIV